MFSQQPIRIIGAISLDNEITRAYVSSMKEFHGTFKPLPNNSIIQEQFLPYVYVNPIMPVLNKDTSVANTTPPIYNTATKNRKTRKRKNPQG